MNEKPYIPASTKLPEITVKAIILGALLSMVLAAANAYLGLFAGMTVSASIPASVISMALLGLFRKSNILENNAVQTAASAGESLAAGVIFTLPALVLMGYWQDFNFVDTTIIAVSGGVLGVLFTIPLRSALIVKQKLKFPEGMATAEVLKSGQEKGSTMTALIISSALGALYKLSDQGFQLWHSVFDRAGFLGKTYLYFGVTLSPALISVGYIVGLRIAFLVFLGGAISWYLAIPLLMHINGIPEGSNAVDIGFSVWNSQIRYLGVGAMLVGGFWALISIRKALFSAFQDGIHAFRDSANKSKNVLRTELDTPLSWVLIGIGVMIVPIFYFYLTEIKDVQITIFMTLFMVVAGFLFSAVAGYMAGLVGSSNNPISGITIATILSVSLLLVLFMGTGPDAAVKGAAAAILIGAVVCCAAAIAGDNMQDLKSGHILGATPRNQQIMQMVGVLSGALIMAPTLNLLNMSYGFGPKTLEHPKALSAPQANLMQSVADGVFGEGLPWNMIYMGMILGVLIVLWDQYQAKKGSEFRVPVLAVAVGLYLPFELDSAIFIGGLLSYAISRYQKTNKPKSEEVYLEAKKVSNRTGLLFASGLITGEALVGILIAIPIAVYKSSDIMKLIDKPLGAWLGMIAIFGLFACFSYLTIKTYKDRIKQ